MAVTPDMIAVALGRATPTDPLELAQWEMWITDALLLISIRLGDPAELDQAKLDYVVREAVVAHIRKPDDATQVDVAVDDARVSKRFSSGYGRVAILGEWWDLLSPEDAGAFSIDTLPTYSTSHSDICTLNFGGAYCSCGAVLTNLVYPLWEGGAIS